MTLPIPLFLRGFCLWSDMVGCYNVILLCTVGITGHRLPGESRYRAFPGNSQKEKPTGRKRSEGGLTWEACWN